jgi:acyl-coenzyme A thioesterase PaaI-like protein
VRETVTVDPAYYGFEASGHGGYTAGLVSGLLEAPAEVTIRQRIPLGEPMDVVRSDGRRVELRRDGAVVLQAVPAEPRADIPPSVGLAEAEAATREFRGFTWTPTATCMTCGTERGEGEGLRVFAGPAGDHHGLVAAAWVPHANFAGPDGVVADAFVWAALDCPGAWALRRVSDGPYRRSVTVQMTGRVLGQVRAGEPYVVMAWPVPGRRRLLDCASAVYDAGGDLVALATAVWLHAERPGASVLPAFAADPPG